MDDFDLQQEFLDRIKDRMTVVEIADMLDIDIEEFVDAFSHLILAEREVFIEYIK